VKIADFGVARLKASDLTRSGGYLGSPGYMSPEQIRSGALDGRSDLFALAVVLYEALCGKRPFHGEDLVSLAYSIAHDTQVPLSRQLRDCPAALDRFFDRALSKDPGQRFADGAAFRDALLNAGKQVPSHSAGQVVMGAATVGVAPTAPVVGGSVLETRPVASGSKARRAGRGRLVGLTLAAAGLVLSGIAAAVYLTAGRPSPPKSEVRADNARPPAAATVSGQTSSGALDRWPASLSPAPPLAQRHDTDRVRAAPTPRAPRPPHPRPARAPGPLSRRARPLRRLARPCGPGRTAHG
jgi:serine/threonine-protein kinase